MRNRTPPKKNKVSKRKKKFSKLGLYVGFSVGYIAIYSIIVLAVFAIKGIEPEVLTKCVYGFFGGEVTISGLIKIFNIREEHKQVKKMEETEDEEL